MKYRMTDLQVGYNAEVDRAQIEIKCMRADRILHRDPAVTEANRERVLSYPKAIVLKFHGEAKVKLFRQLAKYEDNSFEIEVIEDGSFDVVDDRRPTPDLLVKMKPKGDYW